MRVLYWDLGLERGKAEGGVQGGGGNQGMR